MGETVENSARSAHVASAKDSYSRSEVARILNVRAERLSYWAQKDLIEPKKFSNNRCQFDFGALVGLKKIMSLRENGVSLQHIRKRVDWLREKLPNLRNPLSSLEESYREKRETVARYEGLILDDFGQLCLSWTEDRPEEFVSDLRSDEWEADQALSLFEKACELEDDPNRLDDACEAYQRAVDLEPGFSDAHCNLGTHFYNKGQTERALNHYELAIASNASHLEAHFNLGNLLEEKGDNQGALFHYRKAAEIDPFFPESALNLALLYEKLDFINNARRQWRQYLSLCPEGHWADMARKRVNPKS